MKKGFRYRCTDCGTRRTLARKVEQYLRVPPCRCCGSKRFTFDKFRNERELKYKPCSCDGYHFPHRPGGGVWCIHSDRQPSPDDHAARFGGLPEDYHEGR